MIIPSLGDLVVALDTSSLGNVVLDDASVDRFAEVVGRRRVTVLVSTLVLFEFSANADVEKVFGQLHRLQRLCRILGTRFCPAFDHEQLMRAETERWLLDAPVHERGWRNFASAPSSKVLEVAQQLPGSAEWLRKLKSGLFETDRGLYRLMAERMQEIRADFIVRAICSDEPLAASDMMIERAAELSEGRKAAAAIAEDPRRFKATHAVAHLVWRLCLANSIERPDTASGRSMTSAARAQEEVIGKWRTKKTGQGTWYDVFIAGAAAYADLLISDDGDQRRRCDFLRERHLLTFHAVSLEDFLNNKIAR